MPRVKSIRVKATNMAPSPLLAKIPCLLLARKGKRRGKEKEKKRRRRKRKKEKRKERIFICHCSMKLSLGSIDE